MIEKLRKEHGLTVFLTNALYEDAAVADYVVILDSGKKVAEGTPHELKTQYATDLVRLYRHLDEAESYFNSLGCRCRRERDFLEAEIKGTDEITRLICRKPELFEDYEVLKGNMDSVFLKVTGKDLQER